MILSHTASIYHQGFKDGLKSISQHLFKLLASLRINKTKHMTHHIVQWIILEFIEVAAV